MHHTHYTFSNIFLVLWFGSSIISYFLLMGYHNNQFKKKLEYEYHRKWDIATNLISGLSGLVVTLILCRPYSFGWRPLTTNEEDQYKMLAMLENTNNSYDSCSDTKNFTTTTRQFGRKRYK